MNIYCGHNGSGLLTLCRLTHALLSCVPLKWSQHCCRTMTTGALIVTVDRLSVVTIRVVVTRTGSGRSD